MGLLCKWVKYNNFFIYTFFENSHTGQTRRRKFMVDGSNDAQLCMGMPFMGFIDIAAHFRGEIPPPKKKQFWGRE